MSTFKQLIADIREDLPASENSCKTFIINYFYSPRFRILLNHRIGKYFFYSRSLLLRQFGNYYKYRLVVKRSCDISYNATIGKNLRLPHPIGIVVGDRVVIKDNVMVFQHVTFGSHGKKEKESSYPVIESGVKIYAGAKILGGITIGENAVIGANAVVLNDVPSRCIAVGIPARIIQPKTR